MGEEYKHLPLRDLVEAGLLQESNRLFWHPLGLELALEGDSLTEWLAVRDRRGELPGACFPAAELDTDDARAKAQRVRDDLLKRWRHRVALFGAGVQPVPGLPAERSPSRMHSQEDDHAGEEF